MAQRKVRPYWTVLVMDQDDIRWCIHNGFYLRGDAIQEAKDYRDSTPGARTRLILTDDNQKAIEEKVNQINSHPLD